MGRYKQPALKKKVFCQTYESEHRAFPINSQSKKKNGGTKKEKKGKAWFIDSFIYGVHYNAEIIA